MVRRRDPDRQKVRRFTPTEITYHWAQALPWLACAATGGILLLKGGGAEHHARDVVGWVHRLAGASFVLGTTLVFLAGDRRVLLGNLRTAMRWTREDFRWLALSPLAALGLSVELPPPDRMNPGQKLNLLAQAMFLPVFAVTGVAMWLFEGGLLVWFAHVAAFAVALPLVLGHIYLAVIHPSTRRGLRGMIDGRVDRDWAAHHHPRWIQEARPPSHPAARPAFFLRIAVVLFLLTAVGGLAIAFHAAARIDLPAALGRVRRAVEPGRLSRPHRNVPRLADCTACHAATGTPPDAKCTACHGDVAKARVAKTGWHGKLTGACFTCHDEHHGARLVVFDQAAFNHRQAVFHLRGAHRDLACAKCHERPGPNGIVGMQWQGVPHASCTDCHRDPHRKTLGNDCTRCHSEAGFTGRNVKFSHRTDSKFPLVGAHARLACAKCHKAPAGGGLPDFAATPTDCASCHENAHRVTFHRACTACHGSETWTGRGLRFRHDLDTSFPLTGKHRDLACTKCHEPVPGGDLASAAFTATPVDCAACHRTPHGRDVPKACTKCHTTAGFGPDLVKVDHSRFPLTGAHSGVACERCHEPPAPGGELATAAFESLSTKCASCHEDPHRGQFEGESCAKCHSPTDWHRTSFDHAAVFPLDGNHRGLDCSACHETEAFRASRSCQGCHADVVGELAGKTTLPPGALPPDPHRGKVGCARCHDPSGATRRRAVMAVACTKCHARSYAGLFVDRMSRIDREVATVDTSPNSTPADRARAAHLARLARHDYVPAERRLRALAASRKGGK